MKAEERHELQKNDLSSWLQYGFPMWIKNNGSYILLVLALALLGYNLWNWYERKQEAQAQAAWAELAATDNPGVENKAVKLQTIIDQYDSRPIRALALRSLGLYYLENVAAGVAPGGTATSTVTVDKKDALNRAQAAFERIVKEYPEQTLAAGAAKLGLARIAEDRGEWDSAKKQYEAIVDKSSPFAGTAFANDASRRLALLDKFKSAPDLDVAATATAPATRPSTGSTIDPLPLEPALPPSSTLPAK
jgi:predicted negative regulator of RcsB-dependent stress response